MKLQSVTGIIRESLAIVSPPKCLDLSLKRTLTFPNPKYEAALKFSPSGFVGRGIPEFVRLWEEESNDTEHGTGNVLRVPRGVNIQKLSKLARAYWRSIKWQDYRVSCPAIFPKLRIALNSEQKRLLQNFKSVAFEAEAPFGNLLYVSPTGTGKTLTQAEMARMTGQRTLVLCLTEQIKRAWYEDLFRGYGLAPRDIGLIQRGTWRIGKSFTLASVMTLVRRKQRWPELFAHFGALIVDETDTITAPAIHQFVMCCPSVYLIGATATDRGGRNTNFYLSSIFGPVRKRIVSEYRDTSTSVALQAVKTIPTDFKYLSPGVTIDWHDLSAHMMLDRQRNDAIAREARRDWRRGESVLIITKRVAHVHLLQELLQEMGVTDCNVLTGETNADRNYTAMLVKSILSRKVRCVVATAQAIKRGANLNPMSVLLLAMPVAQKRDLEQLIGRIRRRAQGKNTCVLKYFLDIEFGYLFNLYKRIAIPTFRKLKVPGFENLFVA